MIRKNKSVKILGICSLCAALLVPGYSFAEASISYVPENEFHLSPKANPSEVEFFKSDESPTRATFTLGSIVVDSDGSQDEAALIELAKVKAAQLGGDFVALKKTTGRTRMQRDGSSRVAVPILRVPMLLSGSSPVGTERKVIPKMMFDVGVYTKTTLGITWSEEALKRKHFVIGDFRSYSLAPQAGLKINDEVLEINGMQPSDKRAKMLLMKAAPGDKIPLYVRRGDERMNLEVPVVASK